MSKQERIDVAHIFVANDRIRDELSVVHIPITRTWAIVSGEVVLLSELEELEAYKLYHELMRGALNEIKKD
jgi:hypothetical protein